MYDKKLNKSWNYKERNIKGIYYNIMICVGKPILGEKPHSKVEQFIIFYNQIL